MKKRIILLTDAKSAPAVELLETLRSAGIEIRAHDLNDLNESQATAETCLDDSAQATTVIYEVPARANLQDLSLIVSRARGLWPHLSIVACRRELSRSGNALVRPDQQTLKRLGFRAVADSPQQLPALLRQVEDVVGTGELKLPEGFKPIPDSRSFSLPKSVRSQHLRGSFALLASLHLASDQKEAGLAALAGVVRLVPADRWSIFLVTQNGADAVKLDPLTGRSFAHPETLQFDQKWQSELGAEVEAPAEPASRVAQEAATRIEAIRKVKDGRRMVALPLVSGERVVGVLEGVRTQANSRPFSRVEIDLLAALAIPIAAALSNSVRIAEAERLSLTDDLTRLRNARYLRQFLVNEIKRARRYQSNVAAVFLDLDDFKQINDLYGHLAGSHALMEVAAVILPSVRDTDCVVRYGGDEFVLILTETGIEQAVQVAERIRAKIESYRFTGGRRLKFSLTASFGVAVFPTHAMSPQQLIASADRAMYQAKAANKNCVRVSSDSDQPSKDANPTHALVQPAQFQRIPGEKLIS
jgi:diguanylate cyclase (GGDEF)-like protein